MGGMTSVPGGREPADGGECSCSEARAYLERFLDRECDGDTSQRLAQHVAACPHCARVADAEVHLREILRSRCVEQAPAELRARVLGRISVMRATSTVTTVTGDGATVTVRSQTIRYTRG